MKQEATSQRTGEVMSAKLWRQIGLSEGEKRLLLAYVSVSLFGALLAFCVVMRLGYGGIMFRPMTGYELWTCIAGAAGAGTGLFLSRHHFGLPGIAGIGRAFGGMLMVCFSGSLIAGTLALPLYGTMFGPFSLGVLLASSPLLALLWIANLYVAHKMMGHWRAERDSIFHAQITPTPLPMTRPGRITPRP
jgi:hypothetical protein